VREGGREATQGGRARGSGREGGEGRQARTRGSYPVSPVRRTAGNLDSARAARLAGSAARGAATVQWQHARRYTRGGRERWMEAWKEAGRQRKAKGGDGEE